MSPIFFSSMSLVSLSVLKLLAASLPSLSHRTLPFPPKSHRFFLLLQTVLSRSRSTRMSVCPHVTTCPSVISILSVSHLHPWVFPNLRLPLTLTLVSFLSFAIFLPFANPCGPQMVLSTFQLRTRLCMWIMRRARMCSSSLTTFSISPKLVQKYPLFLDISCLPLATNPLCPLTWVAYKSFGIYY